MCTCEKHTHAQKYTNIHTYIIANIYILDYDPQPDVPKGKDPMAQCALEILVLNVSAIRTS